MVNTGIKLGPYEIVAMLRAGGIGEVYRAHDTKLKHHAAFKGLPMPFVADAGWGGRPLRNVSGSSGVDYPRSTLHSVY